VWCPVRPDLPSSIKRFLVPLRECVRSIQTNPFLERSFFLSSDRSFPANAITTPLLFLRPRSVVPSRHTASEDRHNTLTCTGDAFERRRHNRLAQHTHQTPSQKSLCRRQSRFKTNTCLLLSLRRKTDLAIPKEGYDWICTCLESFPRSALGSLDLWWYQQIPYIEFIVMPTRY
jgi:hypothetical protein